MDRVRDVYLFCCFTGLRYSDVENLVSEIIPKYELITTHTARKTFVCTAIRLGINPIVIMKITGHKNYNTMKPDIRR